MNLSDDTAKMQIVSRLVKDGAIDFNEAIKLLEEPQLHFDIPFSYPNKEVPWPGPYPFLPLIDFKADNAPFVFTTCSQ